MKKHRDKCFPGGIPGKAFNGPALPLHRRLLLKLITIRRIRSLILQNKNFDICVPLSLKLRAWRHWFSSRDWLLYDLEHNDPGEYLPHHVSLDYVAHYPNYRALNDKLLFTRGLAATGIKYPRVLAFVLCGRLHPFTHDGEEALPPGAWLDRQAAKHGGIVLKPVIGLAGSGLLFIRKTATALTANGAPVTVSELDLLVAGFDQYLVTERIAQAAYAAAIFPDATNTLRILTLWDYQANQPFVAAAVHRFGSFRSLPVDNFHAGTGGLCAAIDIASGRMGVAMTLDGSGNLSSHRDHPETGVAIAGVVVPNWDAVRAVVLRAAAAFPEAPFVGWDIALSETGPVFIEANVPPSIHVWQTHGGLLRDPRVRAFFEMHGMIRPARRQRTTKETAKKISSPGACPKTTAKNQKRQDRGSAFPGGIPGKAFKGYPLPLSARLNMRLVSWRRFGSILAANRHDHAPVTLPTKLRAWRHGFCYRHWLIYGPGLEHAEEYVPDFVDLNFGMRDANFRAASDKLLMSRALASLGLPTPRLLAFVQNGRLHAFDPVDNSLSPQRTWLADEVMRRGAIVLKPVTGSAGLGLVLLRGSAQRLTANGSDVTPSMLNQLLASLDQYMITEYVTPDAYATAIWPRSTNTLRVLTLWDYVNNRPFVAAAVHRFGDSRSADADIFGSGSGGMLAGIELDSGRLGTAVTLSDRGARRDLPNHPETDAAIAGVRIPWWPETLAAVLRAASALASAPLLGWDIVISDQGPVFLGADAPPALWTWQVHRGLLRDPRARAFFEMHGMVRPRRSRKTEEGPVVASE